MLRRSGSLAFSFRMSHELKTLFPAIILLISFNLHFLPVTGNENLPCAQKIVNKDKNKIVCVCNETYCDSLGPIPTPVKGQFIIYTSDKSGQRLSQTEGSFGHQQDKNISDRSSYRIKITVDTSKKFQKVLGFGGAFTDAAGINIANLSEKLQTSLLQSYFGPTGIGYTLGRVPIGGADFSPRPYTYDDNGSKTDLNLTNFSLQEEDLKYKIPFIKLAKSLEPNLLIYGSPWTAPPWMKTNEDYIGRGSLRKKYQAVWANYIVKFLQEYEAHGIQMWGLTTQNEPVDGLIPLFPFNSMGWTPSMQRDWIKNHLGPTLHENGFQNLKLMILDDNTILLPYWAKIVLSDPEVAKFVSGIGVHWYSRQISGYKGVKETLDLFPEKFILATEACMGFLIWEENVDLGSWERGEEYAEDIIQQLSHGAVGWTDWNLALDTVGGPNWANLGADSPIIVDKMEQVFYKQPMFYSLAHFAKFLTKGSQIVRLKMVDETVDKKLKKPSILENIFDIATVLEHQLDEDEDDNGGRPLKKISAVASVREDNVVVVVLLNKNEFAIKLDVQGPDGSALISIAAKSVSTILYLS